MVAASLGLVCCFGGRRLLSIGRGIFYNVCNSRDPIRSNLHIDVAHEKPEIHPPMAFCSRMAQDAVGGRKKRKEGGHKCLESTSDK